jgi:hypothetical protein
MISGLIGDFLSSQLFANLLLLFTAVIALVIGYGQIQLNDVVEIYATPDTKTVLDATTGASTITPIIGLRSIGTRLVYLDKYVFNGSEYGTNGQVLPSTYSQSTGLYWIDLPTNSTSHVSISVYYHDLSGRKWRSEITADFINNYWKVSSLPRTADR